MKVRLKHERLARELARRGSSQNRWALRLGLDGGHLSQLANGKRPFPSASTRRKLLEGLGLDFEELFEIEIPKSRAGGPPEPARRRLPKASRGYGRAAPVGARPGGYAFMPAIGQEIRFALRSLRKSPAFTLVMIVTLGLGIGANTAIFSVVNAVLLQPLSFPEPERLVRVWSAFPARGIAHGTTSPHDLEDWRTNSRFVESIGAYPSLTLSGMVLSGDGPPLEIPVSYVTEGFFEALGMGAARGRSLVASDQEAGTNQVVVLSDAAWRRHFGADPGIVGKEVTLANSPFQVVGVMPKNFEFPSSDTEIWAPISLISESGVPRRRNVRWLSVVARLKPGATIEQASDDLSALARQLETDFPRMNEGLTAVTVENLQDFLVGDVRTEMFLILGAVAFVLLIGCANVANLVLARSERRNREVSVRRALGAGRFQIVRQIMTESLMLSLFGGLAGLGLGVAGLRVLVAMAPAAIPRLSSIGIDTTVLAFTTAVSLATGLAFGLFPALRGAGSEVLPSLQAGGRNPALAKGHQWYRKGLVAAQLALVVLLTIGAALLVGSYVSLKRVDPGFRVDNLLTMNVTAHGEQMAGSAFLPYFRRVLEEVRQTPGVKSAALVRPLPLGPGTFMGENWTLRMQGEPGSTGQEVRTSVRFVSEDYFKTMGIPLLEGRDFRDSEREGGRPVLIVNKTLAERCWPAEENRAGRVLFAGRGAGIEVLGVVGDVRQTELDQTPQPVVYWPLFQNIRVGMTLVLHTERDPASLIGSVQNRLWELNPNQPFSDIASMDQLLSRSISQQRFSMALMGLFTALALALAIVGIYGVLAYLVSRRTNEIGVRMTLGAQVSDVLKLVVAQGMGPAMAGIAIGVVAAIGLTRFMAGLLFGVTATEPLIFLAVTLLIASVALAACYLPARKACRVDPAVALRYE